MKRIKNLQALAWLIVTLISLAMGQWLLSRTLQATPVDNPPWLAIAILVTGALALWIGRTLQNEEQPVAEEAELEAAAAEPKLILGFVDLAQVEQQWRPIALVIAVGLIVFGLWRIPNLAEQDSYTLVFLAWLAAILLFFAAISEPMEGRDWRAWAKANRGLLVGSGAIFLVAFFLRVWRVGSLPYTLAGDEASQGLEALRVIRGELRNPFTTGWLGVPTMSFFYNSLSLRYLGSTVFALRLPWVLVGTATVVTTFLLVRQMLGTRLALATAAILAVYHYHIHYSRLGSNQVADPLFLSAALFFMYRALDQKNRLSWALAGATTGLAFYVYAGARLTPIVLAAVLGYLFLLGPRQFWRDHRNGLLVALTAFLIVAAPMLQYAVRFPDDFNARLNEVGILQNNWLVNEVAIRDVPVWEVLFDQFQRAALAFNYYPDRTVWYGLREPLLDPFFGGLFLLGLLYGTMQLFNRVVGPRVAPMVAWWWGGMILGGMLTESPPSSQRLITLAVPVAFFIAFAVWELIQLAGQAFRKLPADAILALSVLLFAIISLTTYFVDFAPQRIYGGQNAELATQIAPTLNELKQDHRFHFIGAPWMYWGFATLPYLVPDAEAGDILDPLSGSMPPDLVTADRGAVFIVIPPRFAELNVLRDAFPNGETQEVFSPVDGRHMVTLFRVPKGG